MDMKDMKELIRFFDKSNIGELELEDGDTRIYLSKSAPSDMSYGNQMMPQMNNQMNNQMNHQPQAAVVQPTTVSTIVPAAVVAPEVDGNVIESPIIGTYYSAPSPGAPLFAAVGDVLEKGQTLCIIEAMKIMNTIEAEYRCKIKKALLENGKPVEYGQPIFVVEPL